MKRCALRATALLSSVLLAACGASGKADAPKGRPPAAVETALASKMTVPVQLEAIGTVEPETTVAVKSMVNGEVLKVHFSEGQDVAQGQALFTIDPRQAEAALSQAEAALSRTRVQRTKAQADADRYEKLVRDGIVSQDQYETFRMQADALAADVAAQEAAIRNLKVQLTYCTIRSPLSGRTGNLMIDAGNVVKANDTVPLVTINRISPIAVTFTIPEKELPRIRQQFDKGKLSAAAVPAGDTGPPETGRVIFLDNSVDQTTGTIKLKATFVNSRRRLWPGQFATVRLTLATLTDATVVPTQAVQTGQQGQFVFIVKPDKTVELHPVTTGPVTDGLTVITAGTQTGEQVVTDGQMRLAPGMTVTMRTPGGQKEGLPASGTAR